MNGGGREALDVATRGFRLFNEGRLDEFYETMHPDGVLVTDPAWPGGGRYEGREAFKRFIRQFLDAFATVRFVQDRTPEGVGAAALFRGRWVGAGASTKIETESVPFSVIFTARDGFVGQVHFVFDEERARELARSLGGAE